MVVCGVFVYMKMVMYRHTEEKFTKYNNGKNCVCGIYSLEKWHGKPNIYLKLYIVCMSMKERCCADFADFFLLLDFYIKNVSSFMMVVFNIFSALDFATTVSTCVLCTACALVYLLI